MKKDFISKEKVMGDYSYSEEEIVEMFGDNYVGSILFDYNGDSGDGVELELSVFFEEGKFKFRYFGCGDFMEEFDSIEEFEIYWKNLEEN